MAFGKSLFALLVAVMVAFASANEFHHPDVVDLKGADFTEKVCCCTLCQCFRNASCVLRMQVQMPRLVSGLALKRDSFVQVSDGGVWFVKFYAPWCGELSLDTITLTQPYRHMFASETKIYIRNASS